MKKRRHKTRRVLMAEAIRRDCDPVLFALGFRNPRRMDLDRWHTSRRNTYIRWRGTAYDQVEIHWNKYNRPKFFLNFWTSRVERPPRDGHAAWRMVTHGTLSAWRSPCPYLGTGWFGPWRSVDDVPNLVNRRVLQLEAYLLRGETGWWINVGAPRPTSPDDGDLRVWPRMKIWGDPWLDPESDYPMDGRPPESPLDSEAQG
jgi:hypothetical protein